MEKLNSVWELRFKNKGRELEIYHKIAKKKVIILFVEDSQPIIEVKL